jgi:hypothetical protein
MLGKVFVEIEKTKGEQIFFVCCGFAELIADFR